MKKGAGFGSATAAVSFVEEEEELGELKAELRSKSSRGSPCNMTAPLPG